MTLHAPSRAEKFWLFVFLAFWCFFGLTGRDGSAGAGLLWTTLFVAGPSVVVARSAGRALTLVTD